jgi:hypothetical protein
MYALLFSTFLLSSPMLVVWMTYLNGSRREGFCSSYSVSVLLITADRFARLGSSSSYCRAMVIRVCVRRVPPQSREVVHLLSFLLEEWPP